MCKMRLQNLKNTKLAPKKLMKKVLLINPKNANSNETHTVPNYGLGILAAILKKRGHSVLVVDYLFMHKYIDISVFIKDFKPDVVGLSAFSVNAKIVDYLIYRIHELISKAPIIVGGPHATFYSNILEKNKKIDYIVMGEGELIVNSLVEQAIKENSPKIIQSHKLADLDDVPYPDYENFYMKENLREYPIMTSRGCPYQCSFCSVGKMGHKKWRVRSPEKCIEELKFVRDNLNPRLRVMVMDDAPAVNKIRFKKFLQLYYQEFNLPLYVCNLRADNIDEELVILLKKCGCDRICIGVESAHPEVLKMTNKNETIEQIETACKLIKKHGVKLVLLFLVGLPGDNLERMNVSIKFANRIKAESLGLNVVIPYQGTEMRRWFEEHGKIYNEFDETSMSTNNFKCPGPFCDCPDFPKEDIKKAYYIFLFRTRTLELNLGNFLTAIKAAVKHRLIFDFVCWIPYGLIKNFQNKKFLFKKALHFYQTEGKSYMLRKILFHIRRTFS
jgi:anaerobic magnesium-protoporphyrin IX monomethyl ester cyclase